MRPRGALIVSVGILAVLAYVAYETQVEWSTRARLFASVIIVPAFALALVQLVREVRAQEMSVEHPIPAEAVFNRRAIAWFAGFFGALWLVGLLATVPVYTALYLRAEARLPWHLAALVAAGAWAAVWALFVNILHVPLPRGVLMIPAIVP